MKNPSVNRALDDEGLDDVDHALGRPKDPLKESYRNHYVIGARSPQAAKMQASDWWEETRKINGDADSVFQVTQAGREALAAHLRT